MTTRRSAFSATAVGEGRYHPRVVGFFDRFVPRSQRTSRQVKAARAKEMSGELADAVDLYQEAGLPDEAARVLLMRADGERSAEKRIALLALAAYTAQSEDIKKKAAGRKALVSFDVLRGRGGSFLKSEVLAVARELEEAGELEPAADAYALAGDADGEIRALTSAGAIDRLEERLRETEAATRDERDLELTLRKIADLDRTAERRAALELALGMLAKRDDERIADAARTIRAHLTRGPVVDLEIDGEPRRYALGAEVTVGRGDATIVVASRAASRKHLRVRRDPIEGLVAEDLDTRNGTLLAGARISGAIAVGDGLRLELGGEVLCVITPRPDGSVDVEVAGVAYVAPLGELMIDGWAVEHEAVRDESFVVLRSPAGAARPYLGDFQLAARVELCAGDEIRSSRGGPVRLRVPTAHAGTRSQEETMIYTRDRT
jgi:pSer/pThr/pTyr-binding forkhead associated (FHA) protein